MMVFELVVWRDPREFPEAWFHDPRFEIRATS